MLFISHLKSLSVHGNKQLLAQTVSGMFTRLSSSSAIPTRHRHGNRDQSYTTISTTNTDIWQKVKVFQRSVRDKELKIDVDISVLDTHVNKDVTDIPTVVALTGVPGKVDDFEPLITELRDQGIRFIIPIFPGFEPSIIEDWKIRHIDFSTDGRAQMLCSILDKLNINRVDMVLCYSAGSWLGYKIAAEWDIVKSAGFLNPAGARPHRILRPFFLMKLVAKALLIGWLQKLLMPVVVYVYKIQGFVGIVPGVHVILTQQVATNQNFEKMPEYATKIAEKKLPIFIACTRTDTIIENEIIREMATKHLHIPEENVIKYNQEKTPNKDPLSYTGVWLARFLQFERGGHWVHKAHSKEITAQILDIVKHVQKNKPRSRY